MLKYFYIYFISYLALALGGTVYAQDYMDCTAATEPCDAQTVLTLFSNGTGTDDFPCRPKAGCLADGEHQSTWLRLNIAQGGVLKMVILPTSVNADFDFAIFPRNAGCSYINGTGCSGTLPQPVRCTYAQQNASWPLCADSSVAAGRQGPCNATGMAFNITTVADTSEGTQHGTRSFVRTLPVQAGDSYMVLIDGDAGDNLPFDVSFAGSTAQLMCTVLATPSYFNYRVQNRDVIWAAYQQGTLCLEELRDSVWVRISCSKEYAGTFALTPGQQRLILYDADGRVLAIKVLAEAEMTMAQIHKLDGNVLSFAQPVAYTLVNVQGQQVLGETYSQPRDLSHLARGVYILQYAGARHRIFLP